MNFNNLNGFFKNVNGYSFYPNEIRINLAANLGRSSLTHSYGYGLADDRPTLLFVRGAPKQRVLAPHPCGAALTRVQNRSGRFCAGFPLNFVPFMKYPG